MRIRTRIEHWLERLRNARHREERVDHALPDTPVARAAVHEAGHAVAAWASLYVRRIAMVAVDDLGSGVTLYERDKGGDAQTWDGIVIDLAGLAAELALRGRFRSGGSRGDLRDALVTVRAHTERETREGRAIPPPWKDDPAVGCPDFSAMYVVPPSEAEIAALETAYRRARCILDARRDLVLVVARTALAERRLDEATLARLMGPRPWALHRPD